MLVEADGKPDRRDFYVGFVQGVLAAKGIANPTQDQLREAVVLLHAQFGAPDGLLN